ncbi:pro-Pol polyprotein [Trichonephila clavipes]|nr:pro-Pol polyprotein [Trichonephila clavipes]
MVNRSQVRSSIQVMVEIEGRLVLTKFITLPKAKGNSTLLGTDFLSSAGLVLDVKNTCWYFWDNPTHKYRFSEELDTSSIVEKMSSNTCQFREGEAKECAINLTEEVLLRYGIPRRLISDNGTQFVSAVMQQICYLLNIHQSLIPVYHPQANSVKRKNSDLKPQLEIVVQDKHGCWSEKLHFIRFALNTAKCETTGQTATFLNFGRELGTPSEVVNDIRVVIQNDNFVPEITPYVKKFAKFSTQISEVVEEQQDSRKFYADKREKLLQHINLENMSL